jgi:four helix bundle protein
MDRIPAQSFQDLVVWQKAHQFVLSVYNYSDYFPQKEIYGLTSQFRRAAVSIAANIAEGFKKKERSDQARFLNIAQGSLEECRYYLVLANDLGYGDNPELLPKLEEVSELLEKYTATILDSGS